MPFTQYDLYTESSNTECELVSINELAIKDYGMQFFDRRFSEKKLIDFLQ